MSETRSRTSSGPKRFMGGTAISTNRTGPSLLTLSVSKTIHISSVRWTHRHEISRRTPYLRGEKSMAIHHVGSRDRRNDLTGSYDRLRVVRDIDVEGSMHHLV